jgi:tRNA threonylcarbamoyladenosine biosynthesis protein TsaE
MVEFVSDSAERTRAIARELGRLVQSGDVILLSGALGAGKTTFVQGLAEGVGVTEPVTSPTFTLVHEYLSGRCPILHVDPYRLEAPSEITDLGWDEWLEREVVLVVEWGGKLGGLTPPERLDVSIETLPDDRRRISMIPHGERWSEVLSRLEAAC